MIIRITEQEIEACMPHVALREPGGGHMSRELYDALRSGVSLAVALRYELRVWVAAETDWHDEGTHVHRLCVVALRAGYVFDVSEEQRQRVAALAALHWRATSSARMHRDPRMVGKIETALVQSADGGLEVRELPGLLLES